MLWFKESKYGFRWHPVTSAFSPNYRSASFRFYNSYGDKLSEQQMAETTKEFGDQNRFGY